jgi:restriction system protein
MNLTPIDFLSTPAALCLFVPIAALVGFLVMTGVAYGQQTTRARRQEDRAKQALDGARINTMSLRDFRAYLAGLLRHQGYAVEIPPPGERHDDLGMELLATKDGARTLVLAARFDKPISAQLVDEANVAKTRHGCDAAMIVTTSTFREPAKLQAAQTGCALVDRNDLAEWVLAYQPQLLGLT